MYRAWAKDGSRSPRNAPVATEYETKYEQDVERVTAVLDELTLARIRRVAGRRGVSSFLATAARERLARLELLALLDELDDRHGGAPSPAIRAEVSRDARRMFRRR